MIVTTNHGRMNCTAKLLVLNLKNLNFSLNFTYLFSKHLVLFSYINLPSVS